VLIIGPTLERFLRDNVRMLDGTARLAMEPDHARLMIDILRGEIAESGARAIVTAYDLRRPLRRLLGGDLFDTPVLAFNELTPAIPLDVTAQLDRTPVALGSTSQMGVGE
jgi:type III secretion protein V